MITFSQGDVAKVKSEQFSEFGSRTINKSEKVMCQINLVKWTMRSIEVLMC